METVIAAIVVIVIVAAASVYIYKAKKSGRKCIGCPDGKSCGGNCHSDCCCGTAEKK